METQVADFWLMRQLADDVKGPSNEEGARIRDCTYERRGALHAPAFLNRRVLQPPGKALVEGGSDDCQHGESAKQRGIIPCEEPFPVESIRLRPRRLSETEREKRGDEHPS